MNLCISTEDWRIAEQAARQSLEARLCFWDGILLALREAKNLNLGILNRVPKL